MPELSWEIESYPLEAMRELLVRVLDSGGEFELSPKGTSMLPLLQEGRDSVILVKPPAVLSEGDVVLYQRENGAYVLHRIVGIDGETYTMCGDNQYQPEPGIRRKQILALADRFVLDGRTVPADSAENQTYIRRHRSLRLRRYRKAMERRTESVKRWWKRKK